MLRVVVLAALAACGSTRTPVTSKVTTLGYARPPAVVVIKHGTPELVEPWMAGLRASKAVTIVAEIEKPPEDNDMPDVLCRDAKTAANVTPIDEIVVIRPVVSEMAHDACASMSSSGYCSARQYHGQTVTVTTTMIAYRASTCTLARQTALPIATGVSSTRAPIVMSYGSDTEVERAKTLDLEEAHGLAVAHIGELASRHAWKMFPTDSSIERVEGNRIVIAGPLQLGEYLLKQPSSGQLVPGLRAVEKTVNQTTLEVAGDEIEPEPGDELHRVTDNLTIAGFTSLVAGTSTTNGKKNAFGGGAVAARWSWDRIPAMFELQFGGAFLPGVDSWLLGASVAGGLRVPYWIAPVLFVELGVGGVYQGNDGARAMAGLAGVGVGLEVRRSRWFGFADVRMRGFALGDYTDDEENPIDVMYDDKLWRTTTGQVGIGWNF